MSTQESNSYLVTNVTTSALTIVLPDYMHNYVDNFRKQHDKAYERWPPHVNLVFPFIDPKEFDRVKEELETVFKTRGTSSFVMRLDTVDYFKQSDCITVHAKPKYCPELKEIMNIITSTLKIDESKREFCPHMTLGQFDKGNVDRVNEIKRSWGSGLSVPVYGLQLVSRNPNASTSRFGIVNEIALV